MTKKQHSFKEICTQLGVSVYTNEKSNICPFCLIEDKVKNNKKTFGADEITRTFNCFKCNKSGTYFGFVTQYLKEVGRLDCRHGEDDVDATKRWFREAFGSSNYTPPTTPKSIAIATKTAQNGKDFNQQYNRLLTALPIVKQSNYLVVERGLDINVLRENNIKEAKPEGFFDITKFIPADDAIKARLAKLNEVTGKVVYRFFNCEYIMPLYDGDIIESIQGRSIGEKGQYWQCQGISFPSFFIPKQPESDFYYICEGLLTALAFISDGLPAMALTSKSFNIDELDKKLNKYKNKHFILSPDLDKTKYDKNGKKVGKTGVEKMQELHIKLIEKCYNVKTEMHNVRNVARKEGLPAIKVKDYADILEMRLNKNG